MAFSILIINLGHKSDVFSDAIEKYLRLIAPFCSLTIDTVKPLSARCGRGETLGRDEQKIVSRWQNNAYPVALSEEGVTRSSREFAGWLDKHRQQGRPIVLNIGGAHGFSGQFKEKCREVISLSPLTLSHRLAQVVLCEQIYRAFTILNNHPYHKE